MVSSELIARLREMNRLPKAGFQPTDKFQIVQILISELAQQETDLIKPDLAYPVWSPYDAVEAADTMLKALNAAKTQDHA